MGNGPEISELISEAEIQARVRELGEMITRDYPNNDEPLLLVGVLKGATLFLADIVRSINRPVEIDFVAISSYGAATRSSGEVRILKDLDGAVEGKHVVIVEDILDTGLTLRFSYLVESLYARNARSVKVCVLLDKPCRRRAPVEVHYRGFEIGDDFVVGYGMDFAEKYRNLPYVGVVMTDTDLEEKEPEFTPDKIVAEWLPCLSEKSWYNIGVARHWSLSTEDTTAWISSPSADCLDFRRFISRYLLSERRISAARLILLISDYSTFHIFEVIAVAPSDHP